MSPYDLKYIQHFVNYCEKHKIESYRLFIQSNYISYNYCMPQLINTKDIHRNWEKSEEDIAKICNYKYEEYFRAAQEYIKENYPENCI